METTGETRDQGSKLKAEDEFPIINFAEYANNPQKVAREIFDAASRWGFLVLKGHGIPEEDVERVYELSQQFFTQPQSIKQEKWLNMQGQGYDLKESIIGVHEACNFGSPTDSSLSPDPNFSSFWTTSHPSRLHTIETFRSRCQKLSSSLFECFARAMNLPLGYFLSAHDPGKKPGNALRLIRYHKLAEPLREKFPRLCEHTDWGSMTFLFAKTAGLEVRRPGGGKGDGKGGWVKVPVVKGGIVVNVADGLALWTGGVLRSTVHRMGWDAVPWDKERYSMAYFVNANADAPIKILQPVVPTPSSNTHINDQTNNNKQTFVEASDEINATFGDYQAVRVKMIERHDMHGADAEEMDVDPKFLEMVKKLGVAVGAGLEDGG